MKNLLWKEAKGILHISIYAYLDHYEMLTLFLREK